MENYIVNLESKLKDRFKVLKNEEKFQKKILIIFAQLELYAGFYTVALSYIKQFLTKSKISVYFIHNKYI